MKMVIRRQYVYGNTIAPQDSKVEKAGVGKAHGIWSVKFRDILKLHNEL
jgi:hypothetical protein